MYKSIKIFFLRNKKTLTDCFSSALKTLDTISNCQRPVFSLAVSHRMHEITNLWQFELNRSSKLRYNNNRNKYPYHTKLCAFRCLILRPQFLNLRSRNQCHGKLLLSRKPNLHYFRGSRFSQCFILTTALHYFLPSNCLWFSWVWLFCWGVSVCAI